MPKATARAAEPSPPGRRFAALIGAVLVLLVLLLDLLVIPRGFLAYRDSLELVTASYLFQAAHPPGYPIYVAVTKLLTLPLVWIPEIYTRYSAANCLYGAAAVVLFYGCGLLLTGEVLLSALAALALAWSYTFWFYRMLPEVFTMGNLAALLSLWLLLRWRAARTAGGPARRWWLGFGLSLGVGLVCHQTTVLWWPAFAWVILATAPPRELPGLLARAAGPFLLGLTPYLLVWWLGARPHLPMWGNGPDWRNLVHYLLRTDYGGLAHAGPVAEKAEQAWNWGPLAAYLARAWSNFGPFLALLAGGFWLLWRDWRAAFPLLTALLAGPVFITYGRYRADAPFYLGSAEAFYLPSFIAFVLLGLVVVDRLLPRRPPPRALAAGALALLVLVELGWQYTRVSRRDHTLSAGFARSLLGILPARAVLLVSDDRDIFTAFYAAWVARTKPDIAIVNVGFLHKPAYRAELAAAYPDLKLNEALVPSAFIRGFLRDNVGRGRAIYLATLRHDRLWGCLGNPWFLRPRGKVFEVVGDNRVVLGDRPVMPFSNDLTRTFPPDDFWDQDLVVGYRLAWRNLGHVYTSLGLLERARAIYRQLIQLDPLHPEWPPLLAGLGKRPDTFQPRRSTDYRPQDAAAHDQAAMALIQAGEIETALQEMELAAALAPGDARYADKVGVLLTSLHDYPGAIRAFERAIRLDPRNQKYRDDLKFAQDHLSELY